MRWEKENQVDDLRVVYLEITSWVGTYAFGASHYYGTLKKSVPKSEKYPFYLETHDLEHKLTKREAAEMNKNSMFDYNWRAGGLYHGFSSKEAVIKQGIEEWKKYFPDADILVLGSYGTADPQLILEGPKDLMDFVNPLAEEAERIGGYEGDKVRMEELFQKFYKYWKEYK
jgi:hypothetical protein